MGNDFFHCVYENLHKGTHNYVYQFTLNASPFMIRFLLNANNGINKLNSKFSGSAKIDPFNWNAT